MENEKPDIKKRIVYMDHDGSPEDIASLLMVLGMSNCELIGVTMTPADCSPIDGLELTLKVIEMYQRKIEVVMGDYNSPIQFPEEYKTNSIKANHLPDFINQKMDYKLLSKLPAGEFMANKIKSASGKVTVLVTGPFSHVSRAIEYDPSIIEKIEEIVFMGGAIDVGGNVLNLDKSKKPAEWNVYWDSLSAKKVLESKIPITIIPLDITNHAPVKEHYLKIMSSFSQFNLTHIIGEFYAIVYDESWRDFDPYFFWDSLSTSYLTSDCLYDFENLEIEIIVGGDQDGRTIRKPGSGNWVKMPTKVDCDKFFQCFLNLIKRDVKFEQEDVSHLFVKKCI